MSKHFIRPVAVSVVILLIPLLTMPFTNQVDWDLADFLVMGIMLLVVGVSLELVLQKKGANRVVIAVAILLAFVWLWAELAVGVFTNLGS